MKKRIIKTFESFDADMSNEQEGGKLELEDLPITQMVFKFPGIESKSTKVMGVNTGEEDMETFDKTFEIANEIEGKFNVSVSNRRGEKVEGGVIFHHDILTVYVGSREGDIAKEIYDYLTKKYNAVLINKHGEEYRGIEAEKPWEAWED